MDWHGIALDRQGRFRDCECSPERTCHDCDPCSIAVARSNDGAFPASPPCRIDLELAQRARPVPIRRPAYDDPAPSSAWRYTPRG